MFAIFPTYNILTCYVAKCFPRLFIKKCWCVQPKTYGRHDLLSKVTTHTGNRALN